MGGPSVRFVDFEEAFTLRQGWCTSCRRFTAEDCEPTEGMLPCPECLSEDTVYGAESAMIAEMFELEGVC